MNALEVNSLGDLEHRLGSEKRSFLLIYKKGSEQSDRAFYNLEKAAAGTSGIGLFAVDVNQVRDIHPVYSVSSAPTLLEFSGMELKNSYKGAHDSGYYKGLFDHAVYIARAEKEGRKIKQVTVYDVSRNEAAAQEMVRRSGQQGVPQTLIGGEMIVGFDKNRINRLLEIQG